MTTTEPDTEPTEPTEPDDDDDSRAVLVTDDAVIIQTHDEIVGVEEYAPESMPTRPEDQMDDDIEILGDTPAPDPDPDSDLEDTDGE